MNSQTEILTELDNQIGFQERNRLGTQERTASINEALQIEYRLLQGAPMLRRNTQLLVANSLATPPTDFNEGAVLFLGDSSTFDNSQEVFEVPMDKFGRLDSGDSDFFTQNYDSNNELQFEFNSISAGSLYMEYEIGAPKLVNGTDDDGLPTGALYITAKLSAGILHQNLLNDEGRMQVFLYGPEGNPRSYSPTSVMGQLTGLAQKRRARPRKAKTMRIKLDSNGSKTFTGRQKRLR